MGSCNLPQLAQQHEQHKNVVFLVFSHDGDEEIGGCAQKIDLRPKKKRFWAQKGPLWAIVGEKRPAAERPNTHENRRYPEFPQDMGDL